MNIYALYDIALNKSEARWKRGESKLAVEGEGRGGAIFRRFQLQPIILACSF